MSWDVHRPEAIAWYWDSAYDPHRQRLLEVLAPFTPFASVLEIGCHCGPVRRRLRERFGNDFVYWGIDINQEAAAAGRQFASNDPSAWFTVGDIRQELAAWGEGSVDVVVSSGCLMCIPGPHIEKVLTALQSIATKAVVVQELYGHGEWVDGQGWAHEYPDWVVRA